MLNILPNKVKTILFDTGNILSLNEIKKLAGQNQTDELLESLKITIADWKSSGEIVPTADTVQVSRSGKNRILDDQNPERDSLKISVKVFVSEAKPELLEEAVDRVLKVLDVAIVDSLVVAFKFSTTSILADLQNVWSALEKYVNDGKVGDIGVSDVDTELFVELFNWAKVKPSIIQVNLSVCCVVPPQLQEFCKKNNVQLLTHSDPVEILSNTSLNEALLCEAEKKEFQVNWIIRFLIHVKCRGVLANKGYLVSVARVNEN